MFGDFTFTSQISVEDIASLLLLILAIPTFILTIMQTKSAARTSRAQFLLSLHRVFHEDNEIVDAFYGIEYDKIEFKDILPDSGTEKSIDKLLSHCELICTMYFRKTITKAEMKIFDYYIRRISHWIGYTEYMTFLNDWSNKIGEKSKPFEALQDYVAQLTQPG